MTKTSVLSGVFSALVKPRPCHSRAPQQIAARHPEALALHADIELILMIARRLARKGDLPLGPRFQVAQERVAHRRRIEAGRREAMQEDIALLERRQPVLPIFGDRAFQGQERTRAELEGDRAEFRIVDPIVPFAQRPYAAGHHDRHVIGYAALAHRLAQRLHARIGILRLQRVFGVGEAVMPAGQPRILIHHRRQPFRCLGISPLPQRPERAGRADDRQIAHLMGGRDLGQAVGHAGRRR